MEKMYALMGLIFAFDAKMREAAKGGADIGELSELPVREAIGRAKSVPVADYRAKYDEILAEMDREIAKLVDGGKEARV